MDDSAQLKELAVDFYRKVFTSDPSSGGQFMRGCFPPLSAMAKGILEKEFSIKDTKKALMRMGSLKAPRPDGFQPIFFKSTWEVCRPSLFSL